MERRRVGLRALKSNLSSIVPRARDDQEIVVTDRGAPVARLLPLRSGDPLERLIAEGLVEPAASRRRATPAAVPPPSRTRSFAVGLRRRATTVIASFDTSASNAASRWGLFVARVGL